MTTQTSLAFLTEYKSKSTRSSYLSAIRQYFKLIYPSATGSVYDIADHYLKEERNYGNDIKAFVHSLNERPPKTTRAYLAAVRMYLLENGVELPQIFWHRLNRGIKGSRARTQDRVPSHQELRTIITHVPIHGKALFVLLASSGMRIGEALQVDISDMDVSENTVRIRGEYSKSGNPRVTFFTDEAKEYLVEWLRNREVYLTRAVAKSHLETKKRRDTRLFPFENSTVYAMWRNALSKTRNGQRDPTTNRRRLHPHTLRKFFRSNLATVIPVDIVEALMGHEAYLTAAYRRYTIKQLFKFYKEGEHVLHLFDHTEQLSHLKQEVNEQRIQLQQLTQGFTATLAENKALTLQLAQLHQELQDIKTKQDEFRTIYDFITPYLQTTQDRNIFTHWLTDAFIKTDIETQHQPQLLDFVRTRLIEAKIMTPTDPIEIRIRHIDTKHEPPLIDDIEYRLGNALSWHKFNGVYPA